MLLPAFVAFAQSDHATARAFFYAAILFSLLTGLLGLATVSKRNRNNARSHLLTMVAALTLLPLMLAVPVIEAVPDTRFINAWFEMVSSLTTTGASVFEGAERLPGAVHLWRGMVGWLGGFLFWLTAIAILAPLNLGGFEVTAPDPLSQTDPRVRQIDKIADPGRRMFSFARTLAPVYTGLTAVLWLALIMAGETTLNGAMLAMATLSTSGIVAGQGAQAQSMPAEFLMLFFLIFALSRQTFSLDLRNNDLSVLFRDPELRLAAVLIAGVTFAIFLRHWVGAIEVMEQENATAALRAFWGTLFMVMSFLTTAGLESQDWAAARDWAGLETPGLILLGLALMGGGVATTAGGVKLLRVYALYKHGLREMEKLVHPSSVGNSGLATRRIRRQGTYAAWIFFMLFAMSIAVMMGVLALVGQGFEHAAVLAIAALSTTGPVTQIVLETPISYASLSDGAKYVLMAAMVLGRLETLAIIALLNPDLWRP